MDSAFKKRQTIAKIIGEETFKASNGWISCWKKSHMIKSKTIVGEKLNADLSIVYRIMEKKSASANLK